MRCTARAIVLAAAVAAAPAALALPPRVLQSVDAVPVAGASLPSNATFLDQRGRVVTLGDYLGARPAILVLGWYGCSNLCSMVLQGVRQSLADAGLEAGVDADVVVVSIDAREGVAEARARAIQVLGNADTRGWHFLTGHQADIDAVSRALAYRDAYDSKTRRFAHAAGIALVGRGGRVASTLPGIAFPPAMLRAALATTSRPTSHLPWMLCFGDDAEHGLYTQATTLAMRATGLGGLGLLAGCVLLAHRRNRRREAAP
jgi:protein SCO1/2